MDTNLHKDDIITDPNRGTAFWRVMDINPGQDQVRLLRCNKVGYAHALVTNKNGEWKPLSQYGEYPIVNHYQPGRAKPTPAKVGAAGAKPGRRTGVGTQTSTLNRSPQTARPVSGSIGGEMPVTGNLDLFISTMENFHQSLADGFKKQRRELRQGLLVSR